jgi:hypothetical protein
MNKIFAAGAGLATAATLAFSVSNAIAQSSPAAPAPPAASAPAATPPATKTPAKTSQSPVSMECSKEADAKGLHGKARREFRSECKKNAMGKPS